MSAWFRRTPHFRRKKPCSCQLPVPESMTGFSYSVADQLHTSVRIVHFGSRHDFVVRQAIFLLDRNIFWRPFLDHLVEVLHLISTLYVPRCRCLPHYRSQAPNRAHSSLLFCTSCLSASLCLWLRLLSASSPSQARLSSVAVRLHSALPRGSRGQSRLRRYSLASSLTFLSCPISFCTLLISAPT